MDPFFKIFIKKNFLNLFLERGEGKERGRETSMCGCLSYALHRGPNPKPRYLPWLGIEPVDLCFAGLCPVHWGTSARAFYFKDLFIYLFLERRGRKRGRLQCVVASHAPPTGGTWPPTHACALTGNQTSDPLVHRSALNPLSHNSQNMDPFLFVFLNLHPRICSLIWEKGR